MALFFPFENFLITAFGYISAFFQVQNMALSFNKSDYDMIFLEC